MLKVKYFLKIIYKIKVVFIFLSKNLRHDFVLTKLNNYFKNFRL